MAELQELLEGTAPRIERELQGQLKGPFGGLVRAYLPQTWVFVTERETVHMVVDRDGRVRAGGGPANSPDVTVEISHGRLLTALKTRDRAQVPPGPTKVTPHTERGRTAFQFVRSRLGL